MKKKAIIISLMLASVVAAVTLEIGVPNYIVTDLLAAFNTAAGKTIRIEIYASDPDEGFYKADWEFEIQPKGEAETAKEFGERFIRQLTRGLYRTVDNKNKVDAFIAAKAAVVKDAPADPNLFE